MSSGRPSQPSGRSTKSSRLDVTNSTDNTHGCHWRRLGAASVFESKWTKHWRVFGQILVPSPWRGEGEGFFAGCHRRMATLGRPALVFGLSATGVGIQSERRAAQKTLFSTWMAESRFLKTNGVKAKTGRAGVPIRRVTCRDTPCDPDTASAAIRSQPSGRRERGPCPFVATRPPSQSRPLRHRPLRPYRGKPRSSTPSVRRLWWRTRPPAGRCGTCRPGTSPAASRCHCTVQLKD